MKHKFIYIVLAAVLIMCVISGCAVQEVRKNGTAEAAGDETTTESTELSADTDEQSSAAARSSTSNTQNTTVNQKTTSSNTASTASQQSQTTKRQTTTKSQTTTTTTQRYTTTTTQKSGLSQSDVEWVQAQANAYIKSKGISVNSGVKSFSGKISSKNFSTRNDLLSYIKNEIDYEYDECIASGWNKVEMYVKIESRTDGSYFLYVIYG